MQPIWLRLGAIALLSGNLLASCTPPTPTTATPPPAAAPPTIAANQRPDPFVEPNVQLTVETASGTCPATVGLWSMAIGFEGGADHTVVVDTAAIADLPPQLVLSEPQRVVYAAPLRPEFADCIGTAQSEYLSMYVLQLADGQVRFDLDLTQHDGFREIRYADIAANRPYVHWRAAE